MTRCFAHLASWQTEWYKRRTNKRDTDKQARASPDCEITIVKAYHFDTNLKRMRCVQRSSG